MSEWIEWKGGDRPVAADTRVVCQLRNGNVMRPAKAKGRFWKHLGYDTPDFGQYDIVAYRIVEEPKP